MANRLKDRNKQIPNGFKFLQPETGWRPPRFASFAVIVNGLIAHRKGRPDLIAKHNWSVDYDTVANEVDRFNVLVCERHNWTTYITEGLGAAVPPKPMALLQQEKREISVAAGKATKIWGGIKTLNEWIDSGTDPVLRNVAESRALACSKCNMNGDGDFTSWFTRPASEVIKRQIEKLSNRKLTTTSDDKINICKVCLCPLKLKVHTPITYIKANLSDEVMRELEKVPGCWIPAEVRM